ncbi:MAG: J domain-containing protein [Bacteroidota bacterium]|nr:J domain-containing protein [Bacteroidota bacterium]
MPEQNYYNILQVSSTASTEEIKKAYRRLAMQFHPDKAGDNEATTEHFKKIKEAYEVLADPKRRQEYHYRFFHGAYVQQKTVTIHTIEKECKELYALIEAIGYDRIDYDLLQFQLQEILSDKNTQIILQSGKSTYALNIFKNLLQCCSALPFKQYVSVHSRLLQLTANNKEQLQQLQTFFKHKKRNAFFDQYKLLLAMIIAIIICMLIYFTH